MAEDTPKVSFIIPVLNEEKTIEKCLDSLLSLDYPKNKIEILIAKGPSTDNTDEILEKYSKKHKNIKLLENPSGNTATGRNICIENSTGELLMNYSGHVTCEKNLLKVLALRLSNSPENIAAVGCANISPGKQNLVGTTAGVAFSSFMGGKNVFVQNAEFDEERFSEHVSFSCYRKKPVEKVGAFDPDFWCGQDAELDLRLLKAGYKLLFNPNTRVYHFKRNSIPALFKQMYRYGIARAKMVKKHPKTLKIFHLLGTGFISGVLTLSLLTIFGFIPWWILPCCLLLYVFSSFISSVTVTKKIKYIFLSPFFYFLIHTGYGIGFLRGLVYDRFK
ncbi:MAG: glycosyltransferase family 2 protein [Candidatus Thermoplasmatota archaeon]